MNDNVINGAERLLPIDLTFDVSLSYSAATFLTGISDISPAKGRGSKSTELLSDTERPFRPYYSIDC